MTTLRLLICLSALLCVSAAKAALAGFETSDGYSFPYLRDVWSYDAGQTGASFTPTQYNTGRWQQILGSSVAETDLQYISQHGLQNGATASPFALGIRSESPSSNGTYDMTVRYKLGVDDLGVSPSSSLISARIDFDLCFGRTVNTGSGPLFDSVFNNTPAFSLSFGGTNLAPGLTLGFSDADPVNGYLPRFFYYDGNNYQSHVVPWSGEFDHIQVVIDFISQQFDIEFTKDFDPSSVAFNSGNSAISIASSASLTSPISGLTDLYFRAHTDPSDGSSRYALSKSFLDNFAFSANAVPEPGTLLLVSSIFLLWIPMATLRPRKCKSSKAVDWVASKMNAS